MLIMFTSWTYSTFFLLSLLMIIGPKGNTGQLTWNKVKKVTQVSINLKRVSSSENPPTMNFMNQANKEMIDESYVSNDHIK